MASAGTESEELELRPIEEERSKRRDSKQLSEDESEELSTPQHDEYGEGEYDEEATYEQEDLLDQVKPVEVKDDSATVAGMMEWDTWLEALVEKAADDDAEQLCKRVQRWHRFRL